MVDSDQGHLGPRELDPREASDSYGQTIISPNGKFLACLRPLSSDVRLLELPSK